MDVFELLWLLASFILIVSFVTIIRNTVLSPLRNIPGPKLAALSDLWILSKVIQYKGARCLQGCFETYGDIVRIGPSTVVVRRPEDFREIYRGHKYRKDEKVSRVRFKDIVNITAAIEPEVHGRLRRMTNPLFTTDSLKMLYKPLRDTLFQLSTHLDRSDKTGETVDMWQLYRLFAFDFMGEAAFGKTFGTLVKGENIAFMKDLDKLIAALAVKMGLPLRLWEVARRLPIPVWQDVCRSEDRLLGFAWEILASYDGSPEPGRYDMIGQLNAMSDPETQEVLSQPMIASTVMSYIIAGTDTTATTLSWITWGLARHPEVQTRLRRELADAIPISAADECSFGGGMSGLVMPETSILRRLPYLSAVIREGLRRWPATSLVLPRVVPRGGAYHQGHFLPEGTTIGCSPYNVHHNPNVFPDPRRYDPERWLEEVDGVLHLRDVPEMLASYMPFSSGVRGCQGQHLAEMELYSVIASIVRMYKIFPGPEATDEAMEDVDLLVLMPKSQSVKLRFERLF